MPDELRLVGIRAAKVIPVRRLRAAGGVNTRNDDGCSSERPNAWLGTAAARAGFRQRCGRVPTERVVHALPKPDSQFVVPSPPPQ